MKTACLPLLFLPILFTCALPECCRAREETDPFDIPFEQLLYAKISTATRYEQEVREAPSSVTIITAEEIADFGYRTLEEVFRSVRGFYTSNDRNYRYVGIRGFSRPTDYNNRVLLLLNGHPLNENIWGSALIGTELPFDLDAVERIEIVRGPGSALYGTYAMFAVVNVITKGGRAVDGLQADAEVGSFSSKVVSATFGQEFANRWEVFLSGIWGDLEGRDLHFPEFDDPATNHGLAEQLDWDHYRSVLASARRDGLTIQGFLSNREKGVPTGPWEVVFNDPGTQTLDEMGFVDARYDLTAGPSRNLMARGYLSRFHYQGWYPYEVLSTDEAHGYWAGGELQLRWDLRADNRLTLGSELQWHPRADYRYWVPGEVFADLDAPYHVISFYGQDEHQLTTRLSLFFGWRLDRYSTVGRLTTPRGALVYHPTPSTSLKLLYGQAFRVPNIYELYYEDPNLGYKPNPDLKPEKIRTLEGVWEQQVNAWLFSGLSLYEYQMEELIDQVLDPEDEMIHYGNIERVQARGLELELTARLPNRLHGYASYAFQRAIAQVADERLTNSPAHLLKAGLNGPLIRPVRASAEVLYETERITVYGTKTESYLLTHCQLSARPENGRWGLFEHVGLTLQVRNALDQTYATPGGLEHRQAAIVQDGRSYQVRMEWAF